MININEIDEFLDKFNYDVRVSGNGRWIDQKCTPDVLWSISDYVCYYVENIGEYFTVRDIWMSDYAKVYVDLNYSKPGVTNSRVENEYDKFFSQPLNLLCYARIIEDVSTSKTHVYRVVNFEILKYIARNDSSALQFLISYIEKVLADSGLIAQFYDFFNFQNNDSYQVLKRSFVSFTQNYTSINGEDEPMRIFTKVVNPLAFRYKKRGTCRGKISKNIITKSELMYNRENFRDLYISKPKNVSRKDWAACLPVDKLKEKAFYQQMEKAKKILREYCDNIYGDLSEFTVASNDYDNDKATQIHHIFPKNSYPEIMGYVENMILLTPSQHLTRAHPNNSTQLIDYSFQKKLLLSKIKLIKDDLEKNTDSIYDYEKLKYVLSIGFDDEKFLKVKDDSFDTLSKMIEEKYDKFKKQHLF